MDKPDVDSIEGLSPAISIDQKTTSRNPRSTVGTVTEIYDYLRLLYARVGHPHCPHCGRPISGQSIQQIVDQVCELDDGTQVQRGRAGGARPQGRVRQAVRPAPRRRLHAREGGRRRARARGGHRARQEVQARRGRRRRPPGDEGGPAAAAHRLRRDRRLSSPTASSRWRPPTARPSPSARSSPASTAASRCPEIQPRIFSFNSPHGACPACHGLGFTQEIDPDLVVPDGSVSIDKGALLPYGQLSFGWLEQVFESIADHVRRGHRRAVGRPARGAARPVPVRHRQGAHPPELPQLPGAHAPLQLQLPRHRQAPACGATRRPSRSRCGRRSRSTWPTGRARSARGHGSSPRASP